MSMISCSIMALAASLYAQEANPAPHRTFNLPCEDCHTSESWNTIKNDQAFDHGLTDFTLEGEHKNVECAVCHTGKGFKSLARVCSGCHEDKHRAELGTTCERCHTPQGWRTPSRFIQLHESTRFPLVGAHRQVDCRGCHSNTQKNEFVYISVACVECHRGDYNQTNLPNHVSLGLPFQCEQCHDVGQNAWQPARFDHSLFPLEGAHATVPCSGCHKGTFAGASVNCIDCHRNDFNNALSPNHVSGNFSTNCAFCHTTKSWQPANFNHALTGFPLTGGHNIQDCSKCHKNGQYGGLSADCYSCHQADYNNSKNPNHAAGNFPTTCKTCHTINGWSPATFDHSKTNFPLTGAHASRPCTDCHMNNQWSGLSTDCNSCHANDYANTNNPNHASANYPHDCKQCHSTLGWSPATFDHSKSNFPLTGGHANRQCTDCHKNNQWSGLSTDCYACHAQDFATAKNPDHAAANFPHDCASCHTTSAWQPSTFNHDGQYFPVYSGRHRGTWTLCSDCHTSPSNYKLYSCIDCHEHSNKTQVDSKHRDVKNYTYVSTECFRCHPKGTSG